MVGSLVLDSGTLRCSSWSVVCCRSSVTGLSFPLGWQKPCRSPRRAFCFCRLTLVGSHSLLSAERQIPVSGQEDPRFMSSLGYVARLCFNNTNCSWNPQMSVCWAVKPGKGTANSEAGEMFCQCHSVECKPTSCNGEEGRRDETTGPSPCRPAVLNLPNVWPFNNSSY